MLRKLLISLSCLLVITITGSVLWLDQQFEERTARHVTSLTQEFDAKSVLAIFAHPDDEQLITGLLLQTSERENAQSTILTFTKGEAGTQMPKIARDSELGIIRHAELLKNGYALGVDKQIVWDYPDGAVSKQNFDELTQRVKKNILELSPDLIITFWPESGFSNHDDHKAVGQITTAAVRTIHATTPQKAPKAIAYILAPRPMMQRFAGENGKLIAANQPDPTHSVNGQGWAKIRGWDIHASQKEYVRKTYGIPPSIIHRLYDKEHYFVITEF